MKRKIQVEWKKWKEKSTSIESYHPQVYAGLISGRAHCGPSVTILSDQDLDWSFESVRLVKATLLDKKFADADKDNDSLDADVSSPDSEGEEETDQSEHVAGKRPLTRSLLRRNLWEYLV